MVGPVFSEMAGPNYVKLSGIDEGHSEHVFGQKKNYVIIVIKDFRNNPNISKGRNSTCTELRLFCFPSPDMAGCGSETSLNKSH